MNKRRSLWNVLLLTTVIAGVTNETARAASASGTSTAGSGKVARSGAAHVSASGASVHRTSTARATPLVSRHDPEQLSVHASHLKPHGAVVSMGQAMFQQQAPGTNPMKALATMPGIMFNSDDPQGTNTWSQQLYMHGFQQQEIGMTLDGMPLGEMTYRNYNGPSSPTTAISSENVDRIDVSQSAGAEDVASTNNLGGSLAYVSSTPKDKMGGKVTGGFGSYNNYHTFVRFDSGKLNSSGTKFFASYMRQDAEVWRGFGEQFSQQVNVKLVQPIGNDSNITAFFDWDDLHQYTPQDESPQMQQELGYYNSNYYNGGTSGYITATNAANGHYPGYLAKSGISDKGDAAYYDGGTNVSDVMGYIKADLALTNNVRWITTAYGQGESSQTTWGLPIGNNGAGYDPSYYTHLNQTYGYTSAMGEIVKEPSIERFGITSKVQYNVAHNHITGGVWYENNAYSSSMSMYAQPTVLANGQLSGPVTNTLSHFTNPVEGLFGQNYNTNTFTAFVMDTYNPLPNLALHFGFKALLNTTRVGDGYLNQYYYGNIGNITSGVSQTIARPFLPHVAVDWHFLHNHELFFDISENVHTYAESGYKLSNSPFAVSQASYNTNINSDHPEYDWTFAIGYRFTHRLLDASVYAYRTNFHNRLQSVSVAGQSVQNASGYAVLNTGSVTMNGVDAALTLHPFTRGIMRGFSLSNSVSYNHAVYDNNFNYSGTGASTAGKRVVNYPRFMYKGRLSYAYKRALFYMDGSYTGARSYDYTGDYNIPGYWMADLGMQYRMGNMARYNKHMGFMQDVTFSFNIQNLANQHWIATMGENGNAMTGGYTNQSMLFGAPRMFFGSVSVDF
ncbi:TonB-dependent receptor domain-containing protein [Komagataeibacter sp. FNDCF1]|uniref:TonB-dependent receptor domain-containing protein n=1 Tax=Komagataeibacter sp. FNDCF1 TaxID=2878681 RepID=UPI001E4985FB|nr:TonB-dependent receptor [Komagataeibacter sp. FNDCF1]MCE2563267.1 TonB-dependent receptor plug domain-containing protein [Komagataeibacter sp. FNDCF1]